MTPLTLLHIPVCSATVTEMVHCHVYCCYFTPLICSSFPVRISLWIFVWLMFNFWNEWVFYIFFPFLLPQWFSTKVVWSPRWTLARSWNTAGLGAGNAGFCLLCKLWRMMLMRQAPRAHRQPLWKGNYPVWNTKMSRKHQQQGNLSNGDSGTFWKWVIKSQVPSLWYPDTFLLLKPSDSPPNLCKWVLWTQCLLYSTFKLTF